MEKILFVGGTFNNDLNDILKFKVLSDLLKAFFY